MCDLTLSVFSNSLTFSYAFSGALPNGLQTSPLRGILHSLYIWNYSPPSRRIYTSGVILGIVSFLIGSKMLSRPRFAAVDKACRIYDLQVCIWNLQTARHYRSCVISLGNGSCPSNYSEMECVVYDKLKRLISLQDKSHFEIYIDFYSLRRDRLSMFIFC